MYQSARHFGILALALAVISTPVSPPVLAQENYPSAPIKLVLGVPAGGNTTDTVARLLAQQLSTQMNAGIVVENRSGASGQLSAGYVANSKPDGYTLLFNTSGIVLSRVLGEKLDYDLMKDFSPVALVAGGPQVLIAHPSVPANTPAQFIAHLKANPGKLAYGSSGIGNSSHLGTLLILQANGVTALHVPYKGGALTMIDLVAGRIQFGIQAQSPVIPMVKDKRIKALAIASLKRSPLLPDVPTFDETIMPRFETGTWMGILAPVKTPPAIVKRLSSEIVKALQDPAVRSRILQEGAEPFGSGSEDYAVYLKKEEERWSKVITTAGVKLE